MKIRSESIQRWWPTTQSLDLVEGQSDAVANSVNNELSRFIGREEIVIFEMNYKDLDSALQDNTDVFTNVPTTFLILPTNSKWSVIWNNSFLCNGYDSLCHNLTNRHGNTTIHWSSHDEATTFQTGSLFHFRKLVNNEVQERIVQVAKNDSKWEFFEIGEPLAVEDQKPYTARLKRERLNEEKMTKLLEAVGARPWQEDFYILNKKPVYVVRRTNPPNTVTKRQRREVIYG